MTTMVVAMMKMVTMVGKTLVMMLVMTMVVAMVI